ncbi:hypothetical protein N7532_003691 [Penicillium argentinense]|uniref:M protein, serotype 2.1 n=1 Tax=Penicillium argentinense TaxID=1131581 RepID=A0A9W9FNF9_9EURO|nr:uncharacterized protein N7532_003691 [Penicillium argentinense]KAJ5103162.1 hypothetical protein N7532_003691 [Penicillium argentinense]
MSATPRKPGTAGSPSKSSTADPPSANGSTTRGHARSPSTATNGLNRSPSLRGSTPVSARAAARKPIRSNLSMSNVPRISNDPSEEEARAQSAALIEELREQLQKAETASEQYQKQLGVLQMRLDESIAEQSKLEDQAHERDSRIETLSSEIREQARQIRDLEQNHELERNAMLQEKEQQTSREEELQATIQRLKESVAQKDRINADSERHQVSRSSSFRNRASPDADGQFAPSSQLERSPSRNNSNLLLQKDKVIESLRLELAEHQIKLVEMENAGGGRQRELEKELLEARMANARLMEDNESYQLLLSEKTLTGDFHKGDFMQHAQTDKQSSGGLGSLADELESVDEAPEVDSNRKPEVSEIKSLKDQNKALTLYIERIISRVLQHDGFEHVLDRNDDEGATNAAPKSSGGDKDLPPTPPEKDDAQHQSFLQRTKSMISGPARPQPQPQPRSRPASMMPPPAIPHNTANENPETAPSIPFRTQSVRASHRRTRSEQVDPNAASVVGAMYRGRNSGGGPMSPTAMGPGSRQSMFSGAASYISGVSRAPSMSSQTDRANRSSSPSVTSDIHGDTSSTGATSSPPRSSSGMNNYTGAVMTQNKLRPLRLVSETAKLEEEEAARKKANRASWIPGWFNRPANAEEPQQQPPPPQS